MEFKLSRETSPEDRSRLQKVTEGLKNTVHQVLKVTELDRLGNAAKEHLKKTFTSYETHRPSRPEPGTKYHIHYVFGDHDPEADGSN